ncbi:MAG: D-aminoacyl-tRNA deacylase [Candidatus Aureabacteria bacterium]|nr:D-aminoacyl-tRNA deacylase [Candidatus Auribacterota bacterium]
MRAVIQRVKKAAVHVGKETVSEIGAGLLILLGVAADDSEANAVYLAGKIAHLRVFEDEGGKMNLSLKETGGEALVVSQFTLYGDCRKGRRPSFAEAADPAKGEALYEKFIACLREEGLTVRTGRFGAKMLVKIDNDGPVTFIVES